jgi:hypothetical protein
MNAATDRMPLELDTSCRLVLGQAVRPLSDLSMNLLVQIA